MDDLSVSIVDRGAACLEMFSSFLEIANEVYQMDPMVKPNQSSEIIGLARLSDFLKVFHCIVPKDRKLTAGGFWHNDLHLDNIFVDVADSSLIRSIID